MLNPLPANIVTFPVPIPYSLSIYVWILRKPYTFIHSPSVDTFILCELLRCSVNSIIFAYLNMIGEELFIFELSHLVGRTC